ncbi:ABC transporter permease [Vibrio sp. WXL103]|uniref:ABC transporter permease n=1 Tax=Vibrio sp. WXL103 TaxID=3450710 RepID=UPI003EC85640
MTTLTKQLNIIREDRWLNACLSWVPILLAFLIWAVFSQGIARDLPIGVVDLSKSNTSRSLIRRLSASPALAIAHQYSDASSAKAALVNQDIYAYVVIPNDLERSIAHQVLPQVNSFYNSQYILIGRLVNTAITQAVGHWNARLGVAKALATEQGTLVSAMGKSVPIRSQITALFNRNTNYSQFLVSAVVPALWQIVMVVSTIMVLSANFRQSRASSLTEWLGKRPMQRLVNVLRYYYVLFAVQGGLFLLWFYYFLDWPNHGSLLMMGFAQSVTIVACMIMATFFYVITEEPARALSLAGAFTAPSFAFMGISFPVSDMGFLAQAWRSLLPISHYMDTQVAQSSYGVAWSTSLLELLPMLGYLLPLVMIQLVLARRASNVGPVSGV